MEVTEVRSEVLELMSKRDKIENEIRELDLILQQNGVGMDEPLVDSEGFPLNNIDIFQVRYARNRIIRLQNDYKEIMNQIETGLGTYYSASSSDQSESSTPRDATENQDFSYLEVFAKVTDVIPGSPSDEAGLRDNDLICQFGSVNADNYKDISTIANVVLHSENKEILIRLRRGTEKTITVHVRPRSWPGRGVLGCVIRSLEAVDR